MEIYSMDNVLDYLENKIYIFNILQYYYIQNKSLKFMEKISKNYTHLNQKPHIWSIIFND